MQLSDLKKGDKVRLYADANSVFKSKGTYAKKHEETTVACIDHFPVIILENKWKTRFPIHTDNIYKF